MASASRSTRCDSPPGTSRSCSPAATCFSSRWPTPHSSSTHTSRTSWRLTRHQLHAVAEGEVRLAGTAAKPVLTGKLYLKEAEIFAGNETATAVEEVELTPADLQQLAQRFGPAAAANAEEAPGFMDRFRMNVDLSFPGRVWLRKAQSPSMDIELSGRINLRQEPGGEMQFFGQVEPIPGSRRAQPVRPHVPADRGRDHAPGAGRVHQPRRHGPVPRADRGRPGRRGSGHQRRTPPAARTA